MDEPGDCFPLYADVEVVVLRVEGDRIVPIAGANPVDLAAGTAPADELLSELLDSSVRVTAGEGISSVVLDTLRAIPVPPAFAASPWTANSRPLVVRDGVGQVGELVVRYTADAGLRITDPDMDHDRDDQDG